MKHDDESRKRQKRITWSKHSPKKGITVFNPAFKRPKASLYPDGIWSIADLDNALEEIR